MTPSHEQAAIRTDGQHSMQRLCFMIELTSGDEALYDQVHQAMSPELRDALSACGFDNYTIFRHGTTVVGYAECRPSIDTVLQRQADLAAVELSPLRSIVVKPLTLLDEIWRLHHDHQPVDDSPTVPSAPPHHRTDNNPNRK